ncbi:MAG: protein-L-isoaspartate O-methyltransferase [Desulfobulbaceae bacterium BRH_c16a]|nr:MAG: protein-L-isoaspartate O-methyltransferase [Desulfobulbaceae bacterium BRH_c16a]
MRSMRILFLLLVFLTTFCVGSLAESEESFTSAREELVQKIEEDVRSTRFYIDKESLDPKVMAAMRSVPRHEFVPRSLRSYAYENRPLAIGYGQTISQPFIVALMTDLLEVAPTDRVLEVGTGSGYQAAILAQLVQRVYTIEIIEPLAKEAEERLERLEMSNIKTRIGDGYYGWSEAAPFDAIIVTAAAGQIPPPLIRQLKEGGRMVIPVGSGFQTQQLLLITKEGEDRITTRQILPVVFVPLTGSH